MSEIAGGRRVSVSVAIDGVPVPGVERLEIVHGGGFSASRFSVGFALSAAGAAFHAGLGAAVVTIGIGLDLPGSVAGGAVTLLTGQIDNVAIDFAHGESIVSGRDLAARLIDAEVTESFSNQTSSDIASAFAASAGLAANVTPTTTPVGQYYELAHVRTGLGLHGRHPTRWDLLASLAVLEGFDLSVMGTTLNFGPVGSNGPVALIYGQDLIDLRVDRSMPLAAPKVTVASWNPRAKAAFRQSSGRDGNVTLVRPNLTQQDVDVLARQRQADLAAQSVLVHATLPGELTLMPGAVVALQGTQTGLDGSYRVRAVERRIDMRHGFTEEIEAIRAG